MLMVSWEDPCTVNDPDTQQELKEPSGPKQLKQSVNMRESRENRFIHIRLSHLDALLLFLNTEAGSFYWFYKKMQRILLPTFHTSQL